MATAANGTYPASSSSGGIFALPPGLTMDNTYGATLLGAFFALVMYGVLLHQTFNYFRVYSGDSLWLKSYVVAIFLLDTAHSVLIIALGYLKLVTNFFNMPYLVTVDWPLGLLTAIMAANIVVCQSFFACRVYQIDRKYQGIVWFCLFCQCAAFGLAIAFTVKAFQTPMWIDLSRYSLRCMVPWRYQSWISIVLGIAVGVDTILATVLVIVLHRSRTGVEETNSLLDTLIAYTVTTGALTDLFNILGFVFALVTSQYLYYAAVNMIGTKVYTNSVMAALNFRMPREPIQKPYPIGDIRIGETSLSGISHTPEVSAQSRGPYNSRRTTSPIEGIEIKVERRCTYTTESGRVVEIPDLERGQEQ